MNKHLKNITMVFGILWDNSSMKLRLSVAKHFQRFSQSIDFLKFSNTNIYFFKRHNSVNVHSDDCL